MKSIHLFGVLAIAASAPVLASSLPVADSGLVSVTKGQTVLLNVVNVGDKTESCSLSLSFVDSNGETVPQVPETFVIVGGQSKTLQLLDVPESTLLRGHIDFSSQLTSSSDTSDLMSGCYNLIPTFEVVGATAQVLNTQFYGMPSSSKGEQQGKIKVCHKSGTPAEKTLEVSTSATKGHLGHGDTLGECSEDEQGDDHGKSSDHKH